MAKVLWCPYDGSGIAGLDWAKAGWQVYCFNYDGANHGEYFVKMKHENLHYVNVFIDKDFDAKRMLLGVPDPDFIIAFPDCTFMAMSGNAERTQEEIDQSVENARQIEALGNTYRCPWMVENPVGRLSTLWKKPNYYFDPFEYGGYMTVEDEPFHHHMPRYDGYTKKTCIWGGNGFVMPDKKPGPVNIGEFWGWRWLGGKSTKTKQLRSLTPRGFARAVFRFNGNT